jgi:hypothetical protein
MHVRSFLAEKLCHNFNSFIYVPSWDPQGSLVPVQSRRMWGGTLDIKDTLPLFYENPKGWTRPQSLGKTLISTIQNNRQSFNRLQLKLQLFWTHPSPTCKYKQCNPIRKLLEYDTRTINISYIGVGSRCLRDRLLRCLWAPSNSQPLPGDTQFYLHSNITSIVQQSNSGGHSRSQGPKTNCGYWNRIQGYGKLG